MCIRDRFTAISSDYTNFGLTSKEVDYQTMLSILLGAGTTLDTYNIEVLTTETINNTIDDSEYKIRFRIKSQCLKQFTSNSMNFELFSIQYYNHQLSFNNIHDTKVCYKRIFNNISVDSKIDVNDFLALIYHSSL